jgi:hypothetical protein
MPLYLSGYYFNNQEGGADKKEEFDCPHTFLKLLRFQAIYIQ